MGKRWGIGARPCGKKDMVRRSNTANGVHPSLVVLAADRGGQPFLPRGGGQGRFRPRMQGAARHGVRRHRIQAGMGGHCTRAVTGSQGTVAFTILHAPCAVEHMHPALSSTCTLRCRAHAPCAV
eukprot:gene9601-biopygen12238